MDCPACHAKSRHEVESLRTTELVAAWECAGMPAAADSIRRGLAGGSVPGKFAVHECDRCQCQYFWPTWVAQEDWYREVERYMDRWEYGQALRDLSGRQARVLEVGCGEGYFLERAAHAGHRAAGIDFNELSVAAARGKGLHAHERDLRQLGAEDGPFDAVAFFHVLEHVDDLDAFFADLRGATATGSTLHFSTPGPRRLVISEAVECYPGLREVWDYPPHHQTRWCRSAIDALMGRHGWRLTRCVEEPFPWRGVATQRALAALDGGGQSSATLRRGLAILRELVRASPARLKLRGMSLYCLARRKR